MTAEARRRRQRPKRPKKTAARLSASQRAALGLLIEHGQAHVTSDRSGVDSDGRVFVNFGTAFALCDHGYAYTEGEALEMVVVLA